MKIVDKKTLDTNLKLTKMAASQRRGVERPESQSEAENPSGFSKISQVEQQSSFQIVKSAA